MISEARGGEGVGVMISEAETGMKRRALKE